jgi:hypothetical protein
MATLNRREALRLAAATGLVSVLGGSLVKAAGRAHKQIGRSLAYRDHVLAKGPVGYWRLGEDAGPTAFDETPNAYDGGYFGSPTFGTPGAIAGDPDTAVQFNGTDYVEIPDSTDFSQPTSGDGLTVEVWIRPDVLTFYGEIGGSPDPYVHWVGKGDRAGSMGNREWALRFYSKYRRDGTLSSRPNRISAYIFNPSGGEGAGAYFQDDLEQELYPWIHVVACYQPGDASTVPLAGVQIYKNGVLRKCPDPHDHTCYSSGTLYHHPSPPYNPPWEIFPVHGTAPLRLGTRDYHSFFIGGLDEVAIYPRVLSADEIEDNYLNGID